MQQYLQVPSPQYPRSNDMAPRQTYPQPYSPQPIQVPQPYSYAPQPVQIPQQYSYSPQTQSDIHWVQGSSGAKGYNNLVPGQSVILMDSEANKFYIKSIDQSGMPLPLRTFRYTEEVEEVQIPEHQKSGSPDMSQYLTKEDFSRMLEEYLGPNTKGDQK